MSKRVLITGHGGFVGHHCLEHLLAQTDWEFLCIDSFRHKGTCRRVVESVYNNSRVKTFVHDLSVPIDDQLQNILFDRKIISYGVEYKPIDIIINIASESAVERSVENPVNCLINNYNLAINMLEFARQCKGLELFIQVSTDEVYGEAPKGGAHKEWDVICPSNPYAASKASQEALAVSYWRTYNLPIVITNIMNIIGERQDTEKFLPKLIKNIALKKEMPIYGDSVDSIGTRCYLHAKNVADAILFLSNIKPAIYSEIKNKYDDGYNIRPDRYNICGDVEINNLQMGQMVADIMGEKLIYKLIPSDSARPGYDRRYMLDGTKIKELGWTPFINFEESIKSIVEWTLKNQHWTIG